MYTLYMTTMYTLKESTIRRYYEECLQTKVGNHIPAHVLYDNFRLWMQVHHPSTAEYSDVKLAKYFAKFMQNKRIGSGKVWVDHELIFSQYDTLEYKESMFKSASIMFDAGTPSVPLCRFGHVFRNLLVTLIDGDGKVVTGEVSIDTSDRRSIKIPIEGQLLLCPGLVFYLPHARTTLMDIDNLCLTFNSSKECLIRVDWEYLDTQLPTALNNYRSGCQFYDTIWTWTAQQGDICFRIEQSTHPLAQIKTEDDYWRPCKESNLSGLEVDYDQITPNIQGSRAIYDYVTRALVLNPKLDFFRILGVLIDMDEFYYIASSASSKNLSGWRARARCSLNKGLGSCDIIGNFKAHGDASDRIKNNLSKWNNNLPDIGQTEMFLTYDKDTNPGEFPHVLKRCTYTVDMIYLNIEARRALGAKPSDPLALPVIGSNNWIHLIQGQPSMPSMTSMPHLQLM